MALPGNITTKTVTGTFFDLATVDVAIGSVTFTPSFAAGVWLLDPGATSVIVPSPVTVQFDTSGNFSTTLMCTNDPDASPINWTWHAKLVSGNLTTEFDFTLPTSATSPVDLSQVMQVPTIAVPPGNFAKSVNGIFPDAAGNITVFTVAPTILGNMSDVNAPTPADKNILSYDIATTKWIKSTRLTTVETNMGTWTGGSAISRIAALETAQHAKFSQNTAQTMTSAANVKLQFPNTVEANTAIITAGGTNQDTFTFVKAGIYTIIAGIRCATSGATPDMHLYTPGNVAFAVGNVKGSNSPAGRSNNVGCRIRVAASDTLAVNVFNAGTTSNIDTTWGTATHISFEYEGA